MPAEDYITASCASDDSTPAEFYSYTNRCVEVDARLQAISFSLTGNSIDCPTDATEIGTAQTANTYKVITGVTGQLNDPTPNTQDLSTFSCRPNETVIDYTYSMSVEVLNDPVNWQFWNDLAENGDLVEEFAWVNKSGVKYVAPTKPSIKVGQGVNSDLEVMKLEITWNANSLPRPYKALSTVYAC